MSIYAKKRDKFLRISFSSSGSVAANAIFDTWQNTLRRDIIILRSFTIVRTPAPSGVGYTALLSTTNNIGGILGGLESGKVDGTAGASDIGNVAFHSPPDRVVAGNWIIAQIDTAVTIPFAVDAFFEFVAD